MNLDKYTQKSQEAILSAQQLAQELNHQTIEPAHLLLALLRQEDGVVPALVTRVAGSALALREEVQQELEKRPKVYGGGGEVGLCPPGRGCARRGRALCQGHAGRICLHRAHPARPDREQRRQAPGAVRPDQGCHPQGAGQRARLAARHLAEPGRHLPGAGEIRARPDRPGPPGQAGPGHRAR